MDNLWIILLINNREIMKILYEINQKVFVEKQNTKPFQTEMVEGKIDHTYIGNDWKIEYYVAIEESTGCKCYCYSENEINSFPKLAKEINKKLGTSIEIKISNEPF